jgi:DNA-binding response OmpR family regulator
VATAYDFSALAVLIADKNAYIRRLLRSILREFNFRMVTEASTPEAALKLLVSTPFDLAFIEWAPDFDGNSVVRQLRRDAQAMSRFIPVIVMSAYTEVHHVITSRDDGATQFLAKPFTVKMIYSHLQGVVENNPQFVQSKVFIGPDRRRRKKPLPDGSERRGVKPKEAAPKPDSEKSESEKEAPAKK